MSASPEEIEGFLSRLLADRLGAAPEPEADLFELGLDSIDAVEVSGEAETRFGAEIDPLLLFETRTLSGAAAAVAAVLARR